MTTIIFDKKAGLCPGVKRTIIDALSVSKKEKHIVSYGELIHNPHVVSYLEKNGIGIVHRLSDIRHDQFVVIRAHGIPPQEEAYLKKHNIRYLDLTCPRVKAVHRTILDFRERGYTILIAGKPTHPETIGHKGYAGDNVHIISTIEDIENLEVEGKCVILAQTTIAKNFFSTVTDALEKKIASLESKNTICPFTISRQEWIETYSKKANCSLIIGGKNSSNTAKLYEIAKQNGEAIWIEDPSELDIALILKYERIAVTAGTSTPSDFIENSALLFSRAGAVIEYT